MQNFITKRNVDNIDEISESLPKKSGELSFQIIKPKICSEAYRDREEKTSSSL